MFLSVLTGEEKENFLNLLINTAEVDGDFTDNEKNKINAYALEMGLILKNRSAYTRPSDDLLQQFKTSKKEVQRAIFIELTGLMLADGMKEKEKVFLQDMQDEFDFSDTYTESVISWYKEIVPLYQKGFQLAGLLEVS